jgi:tetratricopeptide (TPR) repeat protein
MPGYGVREVSKILGLSASQLRSYVRAGFIAPQRGARGEYRFSFQDLLLLRTAAGLVAAHIPARRVRRALGRLREQLPAGRSLTGMHIAAEGSRIVVSEGATRWQAESGQGLFDFGSGDAAATPSPPAEAGRAPRLEPPLAAGPDDSYEWACELEDTEPEQAVAAYRRALELEPGHAGALVNLGRMLHAAGDPAAAEAHYRKALAARPDDDTALFNLGVALEDLGRSEEALAAYEKAVAVDPSCADAHYNAARLCQALGRAAEALRHLKAYRQLLRNLS